MSKRHNRLVKNYTQTIYAQPDEIFPLLCPVEEQHWLDGWQYQMIYSDCGVAEPGCVFRTPEGETDAIWVNSRRAPTNGEVQFVKIIPGLSVTLLDIKLKQDGEDTRVDISYAYTALSEEGMEAMSLITDEQFNHRLHIWELSMNHYIKTGEKLLLSDL